jgi:hypothetical protein
VNDPTKVNPYQAGYTARTGFPEGVVIEILLEATNTLYGMAIATAFSAALLY